MLGHPAGLFVLFFTEMWERFSFYGMRALLVLFLTAPLLGENPGWAAWPRQSAIELLSTYAALLYLTPILGGYLADKFMGYRNAVVLGCLLMTLGHATLAIETELTLYLGLAFLIIGTGFFKPNITSIISEMYKSHPEKKDGAYTIFYMGVNAGAFLGILLCGYLGEKVDWALGFGLAGIFMLLGLLQFWLSKNLFGEIGDKIIQTEETTDVEKSVTKEKLNPFLPTDLILIGLSLVLGLTWLTNNLTSRIGETNFLNFKVLNLPGEHFTILLAVLLFLLLLILRIPRYDRVLRDRMIAISIFAFFTIFFWGAFEQAAGSLNIFARDYTERSLTGNYALTFKIVDAVLTVGPLLFITWVLYMLFRKTFAKIALSNIILAFSFIIIWGIVLWKLGREFSDPATDVPATWFAILNSFFIISIAPLFSKWWESKYNPPAAIKYALGLILLGLGFALLVYGSAGIPQGAQTASVSMVWLILAILLHTLGELCLSPVGLSYLSKLVPGRMIAIMFGVWYLAIAIGQKLAGTMGGMIDEITKEYSISFFFLILTLVPIGAGVVVGFLHPLLKKLMHQVK